MPPRRLPVARRGRGAARRAMPRAPELVGEAAPRASGAAAAGRGRQRQLGADLDAGRQVRQRATAHEQPACRQAARRHAHLGRRPEGVRSRGSEQEVDAQAGRQALFLICATGASSACSRASPTAAPSERRRRGRPRQTTRDSRCRRTSDRDSPQRRRRRERHGRGEAPWTCAVRERGRRPRRGTAAGCGLPHGCSASRSVASRFSPMPSTLRQLVDRAEAAVGVAVLDDPLRERGADAVDLVELVDGGGRKVDLRAGLRPPRPLRGRRGAPASPARRSAGRPAPSRRGSRASGPRAAGRSARAVQRRGHPRVRGQPDQARASGRRRPRARTRSAPDSGPRGMPARSRPRPARRRS